MIRGIPRKVQREPKKFFVELNPFGSFPRQWTLLRRHQSSLAEADVGPQILWGRIGIAEVAANGQNLASTRQN